MANRFNSASSKNKDNRSSNLLNDHQSVAYAASIALSTKANVAKTLVVVGQLTGALTLTAGVSNPSVGDKMDILFSCDGTSRTVTFSTGFAASGNLVLAINKYGSASFMFNGTVWVEVGRAATA